eukprot:scaffold1525_cov328-Pavlova_lutheri.AAC.3
MEGPPILVDLRTSGLDRAFKFQVYGNGTQFYSSSDHVNFEPFPVYAGATVRIGASASDRRTSGERAHIQLLQQVRFRSSRCRGRESDR